MLSSSSGSLSLRGRPSGLPLSAAAAGSPETPQLSAAAGGVAFQGPAGASAVPVPAQLATGFAAGAVWSAPDSAAASTVAACSVLNSSLPSSPPQP